MASSAKKRKEPPMPAYLSVNAKQFEFLLRCPRENLAYVFCSRLAWRIEAPGNVVRLLAHTTSEFSFRAMLTDAVLPVDK